MNVEVKRTGDQVYKRIVFKEKSYELALMYYDGFDNVYSSMGSMYRTKGADNITGVSDKTLNSLFDKWEKEVETEKCPLFLAKMVKDVKISESPDFIKKRLVSAGMRPINNVVDISNYVMLEYGQPLHFYDKDKLGNKIVVKNAKDDYVFTTLDGKERVLNSNDIVLLYCFFLIALFFQLQ